MPAASSGYYPLPGAHMNSYYDHHPKYSGQTRGTPISGDPRHYPAPYLNEEYASAYPHGPPIYAGPHA